MNKFRILYEGYTEIEAKDYEDAQDKLTDEMILRDVLVNSIDNITKE